MKSGLGYGWLHYGEDSGGDGRPLVANRCRHHEVSSRSAACSAAVLADNQVKDELLVVLVLVVALASSSTQT